MSDALTPTARLARALTWGTAAVISLVVADALIGDRWRADARAEAAAALALQRPGWLPPGQHPADAPAAIPMGFTPGAEAALPPTRRLIHP